MTKVCSLWEDSFISENSQSRLAWFHTNFQRNAKHTWGPPSPPKSDSLWQTLPELLNFPSQEKQPTHRLETQDVEASQRNLDFVCRSMQRSLSEPPNPPKRVCHALSDCVPFHDHQTLQIGVERCFLRSLFLWMLTGHRMHAEVLVRTTKPSEKR